MTSTAWRRCSREHVDNWLSQRQRARGAPAFKATKVATVTSVGISAALVVAIAASMGIQHVAQRAQAQQLADAQWQSGHWKCSAARSVLMREACFRELPQPAAPTSAAERSVVTLAQRVMQP